jgi:NTP pyrophosphatase (non-canonical NTP hydrolase)
MGGKEYQKQFLRIEGIFREKGDLFGKEWAEVRRQQIGFLLERPLMLKVLTQPVWGPAWIQSLWTGEWGEAEEAFRKLGIDQKKEELADMEILLLTLDILNPDLLLPSQINLLRNVNDVVGNYCKQIGLNRESLIPIAIDKIEINKKRNPPEAYGLVAHEDMETSKKRMEGNWQVLKKIRDKMPKGKGNQNWWKKWLPVNKGGWVTQLPSL